MKITKGNDMAKQEIKNKLTYEIMAKSESRKWEQAIKEWTVVGCYEDRYKKKICVCGKGHLQYVFMLVNKYNDLIIYPIGKDCIKKLGRQDLTQEAEFFIERKKLENFAKENYLTLANCGLSKKMLIQLYKEGVFKPNKHNNYKPDVDCRFLIKMIDKKDKSNISENEQKKIKALMLQIKEYLKKTMSK